MSVVIASLYLPNFEQIMAYVNPNKREYCDRWNYRYMVKTDGFTYPTLGFDKIAFMLDVLADNAVEYLWWQDADTLVTNMTKTVEGFMSDKKDVVTAPDNGYLNCGSFIVRNTPEVVAFLQMVLSKHEVYQSELPKPDMSEQAYITNLLRDGYFDLRDIVSLRDINSFPDELYALLPEHVPNGDTWKNGDWLVHFTGLNNDTRLELVTKYKDTVTR